MPGKVNPVIPEMVTQVCLKVIANDSAITGAAMSGQLELNAFMPLIAESLLESLELLLNTVPVFKEKCIDGIEIDADICREHVEKSSALATALVRHIGYDRAADVAKKAQAEKKTIRQVISEEKVLDEELCNKVLDPYQVTKPGIPGY